MIKQDISQDISCIGSFSKKKLPIGAELQYSVLRSKKLKCSYNRVKWAGGGGGEHGGIFGEITWFLGGPTEGTSVVANIV